MGTDHSLIKATNLAVYLFFFSLHNKDYEEKENNINNKTNVHYITLAAKTNHNYHNKYYNHNKTNYYYYNNCNKYSSEHCNEWSFGVNSRHLCRNVNRLTLMNKIRRLFRIMDVNRRTALSWGHKTIISAHRRRKAPCHSLATISCTIVNFRNTRNIARLFNGTVKVFIRVI